MYRPRRLADFVSFLVGNPAVLRQVAAYAAGTVRVSDVVVPSVFTPYRQQLTTELSNILRSGIMQRNAALDALLAGPGLTYNMPNWKDLDNDDENISNDDPADTSEPNKIGTMTEVGVRMSRNSSWASMDLTAQLIAADPMDAIARRVAAYWDRRRQRAIVAIAMGVLAMNDAAPAGGSTHTAGDMTLDISGGAYSAGVTDFSAEAVIQAEGLMGDAVGALGSIMVHSVIYNRMRVNNLIDFIPDATNPAAAAVPTFLGRRVVVDDGMPNPAGAGAADLGAGIYDTWIFAPGFFQYGEGSPETPTEVVRKADIGNGAGGDVLHDRVEWLIHPVGHAYIGTPPVGGPSNASTTNNLAAATSWRRVYPERKQIGFVRLRTRES